MKKMLTVVLLLTMLVSAAYAESIFDLPTNTNETTTDVAPSYGVMTDTVPMNETVLDDGSICQVYTGVTVEDFEAYGILLGKNGYETNEPAMTNGEYSFVVNINAISFTVAYHQQNGILTVTYPAGVAIEQPELPDPFEGYVRINFGENVRIYDPLSGVVLGEVTIHNFYQNTEYYSYIEQYSGNLFKSLPLNSYFTGSFNNLSDTNVELPIILDAQLHYINTDNHYYYNLYNSPGEFDVGIISDNNITIYCRDASSSSYVSRYKAKVAPSMETTEFGCGFYNLPERVATATDGILALTFTFPGVDTPYVLYIYGGN